MINTKTLGIVLAAFVAGAFIASPELRAYAANTIGSGDIINESILSADIKNGEVKAADIATDAVGAAELQGVTKLLFGQCVADSTEGSSDIVPGGGRVITCTLNGVDSDDSVLATINDGNNCFDDRRATPSTNTVTVVIVNDCNVTTKFGTGSGISLIVFDK